jgi:hypothetical protein
MKQKRLVSIAGLLAEDGEMGLSFSKDRRQVRFSMAEYHPYL